MGRGTSRNVSANAIASSEDKPVGDVLQIDVTLEIVGMVSLRRVG